jgi:60 kDa SS-A/Ro ribonucleoprotein
MTRYSQHVSALATPQSEQARPEQVKNNAGGYTFALDKWKRLDRFLVLGSEGGTYYVGERELTRDNAKCIDECIAEDGLRTVKRIVEISDAGRAPKNDPAIFALAMCAGAKDSATRVAALAALPKVCRIGTHLFHFAQDVEGFRRWGRSLRRAVGAWYTDRKVESLALQAIKYQQRDGWSHRDLLRLSHPKAPTPEHDVVLRWITAQGDVTKETKRGKALDPDKLPSLIQAFVEIMRPGVDPQRAIQLIAAHKLPHECVPNELKGNPKTWEALLDGMGITAVIRNLAKMTAVGLLKPMSQATQRVAALLTDTPKLFAGRVHPLTVLFALKTYESGHGLKGSLSWEPVREIVDALDEAFYLSFQAIEPTGKRFLLGLDVSGSMVGNMISGTSLDARQASAAMAMVTARSEKNWHAVGFAAGAHGYGGMHGGSPSKMVPVSISPRQRLDDVVRAMEKIPMGGTDCALPMIYALEQKLEVDAFVIYTDSETWAGNIHPFQALQRYRQAIGIPAKLIVVGMTATEFTIADPNDNGMLDVAGFDAAVPGIMADFVASREVVS